MADLVIVSMHENGFPQADMYRDASDIEADEFDRLSMSPDDFFTMRKGDTIDAAMARAAERWPGADIRPSDTTPDDDHDEDDCS